MSDIDDVEKVVKEICERGERILDEFEQLSKKDREEVLPQLEAIRDRENDTLAILDEIQKRSAE